VAVCLNHLNSGGKIILHDFTYPQNNLVRALWNVYFVILNLLGYLMPSWKNVFADLPKLIRKTMWLDEYENEMKKNGLQVNRHSLTWHTSAILTGTKKI
jgi:demethylmenaquinone methyltransferase/2-methoxy-6-polyprenyl-1,4-benzoquinol methylase